MDNTTIQMGERLPILIAQDEVLRKVFFRGQDIALHMAATLLFSATDKTNLPLQETANLIRRTPLCFDDAAFELLPLMTAVVATAQNPDMMLYRMQSAFRALSNVLIASARLILPACALAESDAPTEEYDNYARRVFEIFEEVQTKHPILTGYEDLGVFALYALHETAEQDLIARAEVYAKRLDDDYFFRNSVQALGHALAFHDDVEEACTRIKQFDDAAKIRNINLHKGNLPTILAPSVLLNITPEVFTDQMVYADKLLAKSDAFSPLILPTKDRQLFSALAITANALRGMQQHTELRCAFHAALYSITGFHAADSTNHGFV